MTASVTKQPCLATGEAISCIRKTASANGVAPLRPINESGGPADNTRMYLDTHLLESHTFVLVVRVRVNGKHHKYCIFMQVFGLLSCRNKCVCCCSLIAQGISSDMRSKVAVPLPQVTRKMAGLREHRWVRVERVPVDENGVFVSAWLLARSD